MTDANIEALTHEVIPSPGIGDKDWVSVEKKLEVLKGVAPTIHIDVVDGKFAPAISSLDPKPFSKFAKDFVLEAHLMVDNPAQYLKPFAEAGFTRFIGQVEKMPSVPDFIGDAQMLGEVGLGLDIETNVDSLKDISIEDLDCVLIMTVKAGESGQEMMPEMLEKVKALRAQIEFEQVSIEVDGGVNAETLSKAKEAGANRFVVTSAIYSAPDPKAAFEDLQKLAQS